MRYHGVGCRLPLRAICGRCVTDSYALRTPLPVRYTLVIDAVSYSEGGPCLYYTRAYTPVCLAAPPPPIDIHAPL